MTYTQIPNALIEVLLSDALSEVERKILLLLARKTYGFHKKSDKISLNQFVKRLNVTKKYVVEALKKLQLVSLVILVSRGNSIKNPNRYRLDLTSYDEKLVSLMKLVSTTKLVSYTGNETSFLPEAKKNHTKEKKERRITDTSKALRNTAGVSTAAQEWVEMSKALDEAVRRGEV